MGRLLSAGFAKLPALLESAFAPMLDKITVIGSYFGQAIGDAVAGDTSKFEAIGDYIGTAIAVAAKSAYQAASSGIVSGTENMARGAIRGGLSAITGHDADNYKSILPDMGGNSFGELLKSNAINAGLEAKGQIITGQTPQAYQPTMHSPAFKNAQQEAMLEELKKQNALLLKMSQTSKM